MTTEQLIQLASNGGGWAVMLILFWKVGERFITAIDRIGVKIDEHTKVDLEHHADVQAAVIRIETIIDERIGTPVHGIPVIRRSTER